MYGDRFTTHNVRTRWTEDRDGTWTPVDSKAKEAWARSTGVKPRSKADVQGLVDRYSPDSKQDEIETTESEGTMTFYQLLRTVGGINATDTISWHGKTWNKLQFWTAIGYAESKGNSQVVNNIGAVGLFQILLSAHKQYNESQMKNPENNVRAARAISGQWTNPKPWEVATDKNSPVYFAKFYGKDYPILGGGNSVGGGHPDTVIESIGETVTDTASSVVGTLAGFATILFDPSTWFRAGKVLLGGIMILIVVYMAMRSAL